METRTELSEYKGHALLSLIETNAESFPTKFSFGKKKAQMILSQLEAIKAFVDEQETEQPRVPSVPMPQN